MQWIRYKYVCNIINGKEILLEKKIIYSEENLDIAKAEAYNGNYTIEEDSSFELEPLVVQDTTYPGCYYRMINGEKEWINPPMIHNIEYRTAERFNGKPVYVKAGYDDEINDNVTASEGLWLTDITIPKTSTLIDATGTVKKWTSTYLYAKDALILGENLIISATGEIRFRAIEGEGAYKYTDFAVTLKYAKN